jgi:hypothetical protein
MIDIFSNFVTFLPLLLQMHLKDRHLLGIVRLMAVICRLERRVFFCLVPIQIFTLVFDV